MLRADTESYAACLLHFILSVRDVQVGILSSESDKCTTPTGRQSDSRKLEISEHSICGAHFRTSTLFQESAEQKVQPISIHSAPYPNKK